MTKPNQWVLSTSYDDGETKTTRFLDFTSAADALKIAERTFRQQDWTDETQITAVNLDYIINVSNMEQSDVLAWRHGE